MKDGINTPRTPEDVLLDIRTQQKEEEQLSQDLLYVTEGYFKSSNAVKAIAKRVFVAIQVVEVVTPETHRNKDDIERLQRLNRRSLRVLLIEYAAANGDPEARAYMMNMDSIKKIEEVLEPVVGVHGNIQGSEKIVDTALETLNSITFIDTGSFEDLDELSEKLSKKFPLEWPYGHKIKLLKTIHDRLLKAQGVMMEKVRETKLSLD